VQGFHHRRRGRIELFEFLTASTKKRPAAGMIQTAGRHENLVRRLEHAEHDGADKGDGDIRGNNAQFADERTKKRHRDISLVTSLPAVTLQASKAFRPEKVSLAVAHYLSTAGNRGQRG
jgi:hypothetical protein